MDLMLCNFVRVFVFREIKTQMDYNWQIKKNQSLKGRKKKTKTMEFKSRGGEREKRRGRGIKRKLVANATTWINICHTLPLMEDAIKTHPYCPNKNCVLMR